VWMLGDFAMGKIDDTLPLASELHGHKVLLAGNHDRCWAEHGRRANGWKQRYLDSHDHDRYAEQRPVDRGAWLLHGHVHERWQQRGRMINVGVDAWDYRPVSEATIRDLVADGPKDQEPILS